MHLKSLVRNYIKHKDQLCSVGFADNGISAWFTFTVCVIFLYKLRIWICKISNCLVPYIRYVLKSLKKEVTSENEIVSLKRII